MRVTTDRLLGIYTDEHNPIAAVVVYLARPGIEPPTLSPEATETKYFRPDQIPWDDLSFRTTRDALSDWMALAGPHST